MIPADTPFDHFQRAVEQAGGPSAFARFVGCTPGNISQLLKRKSRLSAQFVLKAEEKTGVSRHDLRPDIYGREPAQPNRDAA